jgi:riboflavin biosynthesis pyrimidine reductase
MAVMRLLYPIARGDSAASVALGDDTLWDLYAPPDRVTPRVRVNFVSSLDGGVTVDGYSEGLSGPADKRVFGVLRGQCDALLVGAGTLRHEGYGPVRLSAERRERRRAAGLPEVPVLAVVSGRLDLSPGNPALAEAPVRPIVITHAGSPADRRRALETVADVLVCGESEVDLGAALDTHAGRGLTQVLSEGGPYLLGALHAADRVDELCLTMAPLLAGPGPGRITAGSPGPVRRMTLDQVLEEDGNLFLRYVRSGPPAQFPALRRAGGG